MRPVPLALAFLALAAGACTTEQAAQCPFTRVATFAFEGQLVTAADPDLAGLDPVPGLLDCTPDPSAAGPIVYPPRLAFEATLTADASTSAAALCRPAQTVLSGARAADGRYSVEASSDSAILCAPACSATLRVVVTGDVAVDAAGAPAAFRGSLVEVLTEDRGTCDGCLPAVAGANPPVRACAGRYALSGTPP